MEDYKTPNQFEFDGILLPGDFCRKGTLNLIKEGSDLIPEIDVLIAGHLRSGCSWMMEIVWLILHHGDTTEANKVKISDRYSILEQDDETFSRTCSLKLKIVITHLPFGSVSAILNRCKKILVLTRSPKDTLVSLFHYYKEHPKMGHYKGSWDSFFSLYQRNKLVYGSYFDWKKSWIHQNVRREQILPYDYELLVRNRYGHIRHIAKFILDRPLDDKIMTICMNIPFNLMKGLPTTDGFQLPKELLDPEISNYMREGTFGYWKDTFTEEQSAYIDEQDKEYNLLEGGMELYDLLGI